MRLLRRNYSIRELYILKKSLFRIIFSYKKIINFVLVKLSIFIKLNKCLGKPLNILIEPTGECNYKCVKCDRFAEGYMDDGYIKGTKNMPFDYYCKIIDEIGDTLLSLRLWHFGEPLLNKDIFKMIRYAKKKKIIVAISSNLSLLTKDKAAEMVQSGLDYLIVSFDGASEDTYNLYHGKNYFNKVINNMRVLIEAKRQLKSRLPFLELQFILMRENEKEIKTIKTIAEELGVDKLTYIKLSFARINLNIFKQFRTVNDILPLNSKYCFSGKEKELVNFCNIPWEEALIRYSGTVIPCALDISHEYNFGKVFEEDKYLGFKKIWNNKKYRLFRYNVKRNLNKINICSICDKRDNNINDQAIVE